MGKLALPLIDGGPKDIELQWGMSWRNLVVRYQGTVIPGPEGRDQLKKGVTYPLPDGTSLQVRLVNDGLSAGLRIDRNGEPLPGSSGHPLQRIKAAGQALYVIAALTWVVGLFQAVSNASTRADGIGMLVIGGLFAVAGYWTTKRSVVALGLAIMAYIADTLITLASIGSTSGPPPIMPILIHLALLAVMIRGMQSMLAMRKKAAAIA